MGENLADGTWEWGLSLQMGHGKWIASLSRMYASRMKWMGRGLTCPRARIPSPLIPGLPPSPRYSRRGT